MDKNLDDLRKMQLNLADERKRRGISQTSLARMIGVSQSHLSYVEACKRDLTPERCDQIQDIFKKYDSRNFHAL